MHIYKNVIIVRKSIISKVYDENIYYEDVAIKGLNWKTWIPHF